MSKYGLFCLMTVLGAFAGFSLKKASGSRSIFRIIFSKYLYIGGLLYLFASIINIYILTKFEYSIVLPLTSITYVWSLLLAVFLLKEKFSPFKIMGVFLITFGSLILVWR